MRLRELFRDSWNIPHFLRDRNANKTQCTQIPASKEMNEFTNQVKVQQLFPFSNRIPHSNTKQTGLFWSKSPKQRENKVSSCIRWSDLPFCVEYIGSQMLILWSNCQVLGQGCCFGEIWMVGPQDKWFWQLLKSYLKILRVGSHFGVTKNCYWVQAHTAHHTTCQ